MRSDYSVVGDRLGTVAAAGIAKQEAVRVDGLFSFSPGRREP
jgi:hypothetical protein